MGLISIKLVDRVVEAGE